MFCSQCGKENRDGTKFCVQCGSMLQTSHAKLNINAEMPYNNQSKSDTPKHNSSINIGIKILLVIILVIILLLIAEINILKVQKDIINVPIKNKLHQANRSLGICETNSYIYYGTSNLYRMDKVTNKVTKISNRSITPMVATKSSIYGFDNYNTYYKVSDKSSDVETVNWIECSRRDWLFISGKCNYVVWRNGKIIKKLNSDKYGGYSVGLYKGDTDPVLLQAAMYKDYIYMILAESMSDSRFIRVSLKTGKEELLTDNAVSDFSFAENEIVYNDISGNFFIMNLDGSNEREYTEMDNVAAILLCANGYVYYKDDYNYYRFSISDGNKKTAGYAYNNNLTEVNGGLAQLSDDQLILTDYDGNEIYTAEP